jgi:transcription elongation factor Elf1
MIIYGWSNGYSKYAELGILECPSCGKHSPFTIYEKAFKPKLFFVTVAKFNKSYTLVCDSCGSGWEISESKVKELT